MKQILNRIISLSKEFSKEKEFQSKRGNPDFLKILNSYPEFVSAKNDFIDNPPIREEKRGTKSTADYSIDVCFLAYLVECLYLEKGKVFSSRDRERVTRVVNNTISGDTDFFDPVRSKLWIDVFSAIDHKLNLFTTKKEDDKFADFFTKYILFYSKLNTRQVVPFYARWIKEITAMYTIYLNETYEEFETMTNKLQSALNSSNENNSKKRNLVFETDTVRAHIMSNIFIAYEKNKEVVLSKLFDYIKDNSNEFVYESGALNKRYRRYYCIIKDVLQWLKKQEVVTFSNDEIVSIFTEENIDYSLKDKYVRVFETALIKYLIELKGDKSEDKYAILRLLLEDTSKFENLSKEEIEFELDEIFFSERRTIEEVVDSVVKILRLLIILNIIYKSDVNNEWEYPASEDVIDNINQIMKSKGILSLPNYFEKSYNDKSFLDFCVVKCIEESFYEED